MGAHSPEEWIGGVVQRGWAEVTKRAGAITARLDVISLALVLAVGVLTLAHTNDFPSKRSWHTPWPLVTLQILIAVLLALTQIAIVVSERRSKRNGKLDDACQQVAAYLDLHCPKLPLRHVGIHIWIVSGPLFARHLRRRAKFLLIGERAQSGIRWTKGKGVVGAAWDRRTGVIRNLDGIRERARTEERFAALPEDDRLGLDWSEFQAVPQYAAVYAAPLYDRTRTNGSSEVRGVVAIDLVQRGHFRALRKAIHDPEFASIIGVCEAALRP
jgi:hypothetical protein